MPPSSAHQNRFDAWLALTGRVTSHDQSVRLPLLTGSMAPAIPVGAQLRISVAPNAPCQVGEVVVFLDGDKLIAHRVLLVLRCGPWNWLLEKGDANRHSRWRRGTEVRGKVLDYTVTGQTATIEPADPARANGELRRTLIDGIRNWIRFDKAPKEPDDHA